MKNLILLFTSLLFLNACDCPALSENKEISFEKTSLKMEKGEMEVYDYGHMKMHVYASHDLMNDYVIIVEKNDKSIMIESPAFYANFDELSEYLEQNKINIEGVLPPYHPLGATFINHAAFANAKVYSSETVIDYWENGFGAVMKQGIPSKFGNTIDAVMYERDVYLEDGEIEIAGIKLIITNSYDGFNVEIPEIETVYLHILGHDVHSEILSPEHLDDMIVMLKQYTKNGYETYLSSHYGPENKAEALEKTAYLEHMKEIIAASKDGETFSKNMKAAFPDYKDGYLGATTNLLYHNENPVHQH